MHGKVAPYTTPESAATYAHTSVCNELLDILNISDDLDDDMDEDTTIPKHGHNNPVEAVQFMEKVTNLVDRFMDSIMRFDRYKLQDAYVLFTHNLHQLLINIDHAYFHNAQMSVVLDLVDDKLCRAYTERPRDDNPLLLR